MPRRTPEMRPFWEGCDQGMLMLSRCRSCGELHYARTTACPGCGSADMEWVQASGKGRLYSFVIVHRPDANTDGGAPSVIAVVELEEGPRLMADLTGLEGGLDRLRIDMPLEVAFHRVRGQAAGFSFRPRLS
jgi:uncharacterized OB-fold protein